jgi:hypothetical protein
MRRWRRHERVRHQVHLLTAARGPRRSTSSRRSRIWPAWDEVLAERDLYDEAIVYLADEPAQKQSITDEINRRAQIIGQRFPQMRRMLVLTRPVDRAFDGSVDIWCPIVGRCAEDVGRRT